MGRETKAGSSTFRQVDYSARTKLKFRQPGQTSTGDVAKRDLKMELMRAEREAQNKKRKEKGLPLLPEIAADRSTLAIEGAKQEETEEDEAARKRRKILEEVAAMDADDSDDSDDEDEAPTSRDKGKGKAVDGGDADEGHDDDDDNDDSDDDE